MSSCLLLVCTISQSSGMTYYLTISSAGAGICKAKHKHQVAENPIHGIQGSSASPPGILCQCVGPTYPVCCSEIGDGPEASCKICYEALSQHQLCYSYAGSSPVAFAIPVQELLSPCLFIQNCTKQNALLQHCLVKSKIRYQNTLPKYVTKCNVFCVTYSVLFFLLAQL